MFSGLMFNILCGTVGRIPVWAADRVARAMVLPHALLFPSRERAVRSNLRCVRGTGNQGATERELGLLSREVLLSYNRFLIEFFRAAHAPQINPSTVESIQGLEHLDASLAKGCGAIICTWHLGNWEVAGLDLASRGYKLTVVAGTQFSPGMSDRVKDIKRRVGIDVIGWESTSRVLIDTLRRNEGLALLIDGDVYQSGVRVELFGLPTLIPRGPAVLSMKTGAPIIPSCCIRDDEGRLRVTLGPPIQRSEEDGNLREAVQRLSQELASAGEQFLRENLGQWCIFRELWNGHVKGCDR